MAENSNFCPETSSFFSIIMIIINHIIIMITIIPIIINNSMIIMVMINIMIFINMIIMIFLSYNCFYHHLDCYNF